MNDVLHYDTSLAIQGLVVNIAETSRPKRAIMAAQAKNRDTRGRKKEHEQTEALRTYWKEPHLFLQIAEAQKHIGSWHQSEIVKHQENITDGFSKTPRASCWLND